MEQNSQENDQSIRLPTLEIPTIPEGMNTTGETTNRDRLVRIFHASEQINTQNQLTTEQTRPFFK